MQNIVIIGFGFMGGMHAQIYQQLQHARLRAIVDPRGKEVADALGSLGIDVPVYPDWESVCAAVDFDVVDICLPTDLHAGYATKAAAAGKAIFCEKPLALTNEEARRIVRAAREAGVPAQVGHCIRFWPEYRAFREFVASGRGGGLLSLTLQRRSGAIAHAAGNWINQPERSGGAAFDLHIHDTDFVVCLLGLPKAVTSHTTIDANGPSHIFTHYHYDDVVVQAEAGWNYPPRWGFQMAFQAVFENAAVEYDSNRDPSLRVTLGDGAPEPLPFEKPQSGQSTLGGGNISDLGGYFVELAAFIDCLESGRPITEATLEQAAESVAVNLAELESAQIGETIVLSALQPS